MKTSSVFFALAGLVLGGGSIASAQSTILWGNTINFDGSVDFEEMSFDSSANAVDSGGAGVFTYEIGTFSSLSPTFEPDDSNTSIWKDHWNPLESTSYSPTLNWFTGDYDLGAGDAEHVGRQAYIWVYDSDLATSTSNWFLATGDSDPGGAPGDNHWKVPALGGVGSTYNWRLSTANKAVWGSLNDDGDDGVNGAFESVGSGIQRVDPGVHEMQAFAVPEPSAAVLLLAGFALGFRRRR